MSNKAHKTKTNKQKRENVASFPSFIIWTAQIFLLSGVKYIRYILLHFYH